MDKITVNTIHPKETISFIERFKKERKFLQIELIQSHLGNDLVSNPEYFVTHLSNSTLKEYGYRIDIVYTISDLKKIIIQSFIDEPYDTQETTAYAVKGNMLFSEYFTNDDLMKENKVTKQEWNGDIILEMREFERDNMKLK